MDGEAPVAPPKKVSGYVRLTDGKYVRAELVEMVEAAPEGVMLYMLSGNSYLSPGDDAARVLEELSRPGNAPTVPPGKVK